MFEACVVGCGQIGFEVLKELSYKLGYDKVVGVDVSFPRVDQLRNQDWKIYTVDRMPEAKHYFISTWTMDSILETLDRIGKMPACKSNPLPTIYIESTINPSMMDEIDKDVMGHWNSVYFPHRWNENDPNHGVFNQHRVIGTYNDSARVRAANFLSRVMDTGYLHWVDPKIAVLSKVVENAYRAMEIIVAQELKNVCDSKSVNFDDLRNAVNTKWNIKLMEARDGVKKKCLPKDLAFFNQYSGNMLFQLAEMLNEKYIKSHESKPV